MSVERCSTFGLILDSRPEVHHDSTEAAGVARWLVTDLHWCAAGRRYEDNGDNLTHLLVTVNKTDKNSIGGYGSPEKFLQDNSYLLGQQVFTGTPPPPFLLYIRRHTPGVHAQAWGYTWCCSQTHVAHARQPRASPRLFRYGRCGCNYPIEYWKYTQRLLMFTYINVQRHRQLLIMVFL